jgi:probable HAF family extracellular repeat protein
MARPDVGRKLVWMVLLIVSASPMLASESDIESPVVRRYKIIELPLKPVYVSDSGEVVGTTVGNRAAVWSRERGLRKLPLLNGFADSEATGSNRRGQIVGFALNSDHNKSQAFIYANGKVTVLAGEGSKAQAVNDSGDVVGESRVKGKKPTTPMIWKRGSVTDLGSCCGGVAKAINNQGQVVGSLYDEGGIYRAFLWDQAHGVKFLADAGSYSSAVALNNLGHVVVQRFEKGVFLYLAEGKMIRLGSADKKPVDARALNDSEVVVGGSGPFSDASHAFVWSERDGFHDLNDMIPANSGWKLETAVGVSDNGMIIGFGDHRRKEGMAFLLVEDEVQGSGKDGK